MLESGMRLIRERSTFYMWSQNIMQSP